MEHGTIKALIAVRNGSERVVNKNVRPFCNSSLLELKIQNLLEVGSLDGVVVSSNDDDMLKRSEALGAEVRKRGDYFATSTVKMSEVYRNMAENIDCDHVLYANVTSPLVKPETYARVIDEYFNMDDDYGSLNTVNVIREMIWHKGKPFNYDPMAQPRSQDLPADTVYLNFAIAIIPRQTMIERMNVVAEKPRLIEIDPVEALDIDTALDFFIAQHLYQKLRIEGRQLAEVI